MKKLFHTLAIVPLTFGTFLGSGGNQNFVSPFAGNYLLSQHEMPLFNRYPEKFVNDVFKDNILLNLAYLRGEVTSSKDIKWDKIKEPFEYEFTLEPNKTFAYHTDVKETYKNALVKTTNAHFNSADGFKSDGYLFGDGVCHLASLINWVSKEASLQVEAPTNHNFAPIPDIPKEFGVSIYANPYSHGSNTLQNLYITNNKAKPVAFKFEYKNDILKVSAIQLD